MCAIGARTSRSGKTRLSAPIHAMQRGRNERWDSECMYNADHGKGAQAMSKRRANHEGTIYKRQDGRWVASVTLPGGKRKSFYGQTRQEVAQKLTVGLKARLDGVPLPSEQLKVGRYLHEW